jgi:hypothetical protein
MASRKQKWRTAAKILENEGTREQGNAVGAEGVAKTARPWEQRDGLKSGPTVSFLVAKDEVNCGHDGAAVALLACETLPELLDCVQSGEQTTEGNSDYTRSPEYSAAVEVRHKSHFKSARTNPAPFDESKPKGMRHPGVSQRVNRAPPADQSEGHPARSFRLCHPPKTHAVNDDGTT